MVGMYTLSKDSVRVKKREIRKSAPGIALRTKTAGGLLLYINENLSGKIINSYKFKENFEIILFEFNVSNKYISIFDPESLIDLPTCYKSINPTCIDLILTNKKIIL